jgi:hypothetical protein
MENLLVRLDQVDVLLPYLVREGQRRFLIKFLKKKIKSISLSGFFFSIILTLQHRNDPLHMLHVKVSTYLHHLN